MVSLAVLAIGSVLLWRSHFRSPWATKTVEIDGIVTTYQEGGKGPDTLVLMPADAESIWKPAFTGLTKKLRLIFLAPPSDQEFAKKFIAATRLKRPHLIVLLNATPIGLELTGKHPDTFGYLILVQPDFNFLISAKTPSLESISNPALVLMSRQEQLALGVKFNQVGRWLKNFQFGIDHQDQHLPPNQDPKWFSDKITNFISFLSAQEKRP